MANTENRTGLAVVTGVVAMPVWRWLNKTTITIDGAAHSAGWGAFFYPLTAGTHELEVCIRMFLFLSTGKQKLTVEVADGQTVRVIYKARWLVFLPGKLTVAPAPTATATQTEIPK